MRTISIILSSSGALLMLYTMICGFWIHSQTASPGEVVHHSRFGFTSTGLLLVGLALLVYQVLKS
jgi:hypothetical protein